MPGTARPPKQGECLMSLAGSPVVISDTHMTNKSTFEKRIKGGDSVRRIPAAAPSVSRSGIRKLTKGMKMSDIDERM